MSDSTDIAASPSPSSWRQWFQGRRRWLLLGAGGVIAGLWLGWDWLAAMGALPLLLALAPCLAMCALGLCLRSTSGSCKQRASNATGNQEG
ncbi:MAG TPA: hypothetical protein VNL39_05990 [Xanthobacteraceae bacterium]|nr:hypothetical protein [Xanthobacteraceae bacterium]